MLRVGIAGIGFMGWIHWLAYHRVAGIEVAAIATRDAAKRAGDWTAIKGNFGPPGEHVDLSHIACYETLDEMLRDPSLDLIDICLPPHLHVKTAQQAFANGKHVFCEKPLALTDAECQEIVTASEAADRQLLVGQVLPFFPEYRYVYDAVVRERRFGKCLGGNFRRIINDPAWIPDFFDPQRVGGPLIDLHVHDAHFIRLLFDALPQTVTSQGRWRGEVPEYCASLLHFADPDLVVSTQCGVIHQDGRPFTHGFEIHCEKATLIYDFAVIGDQPRLTQPLTVLGSGGEVLDPQVGGDPIDAFVGEIQEVVAAISSGEGSPILSGKLAQDAVQLCHAQTESIRQGKTVTC